MGVSLPNILAIGAGGFLGAVCRYLLAAHVESYLKDNQFPFGIALVNILGCLLIGILAGLFEIKDWGNSELRLFLFVGLLGSFTTFSTFINDSFLLGRNGELLLSLLNLGGQIIIGLLSVWLGYYLIKLIQ
jgi:CrcB protein